MKLKRGPDVTTQSTGSHALVLYIVKVLPAGLGPAGRSFNVSLDHPFIQA